MRYYLIAGERSGDLHGSNLIRSLKKRDPEAQFRCWGGEYMEKAGAELAVHYKHLAFMGFFEVLIYFRRIIRYLKMCRNDIKKYDPDVVILIDFGGFNLRIAKYLNKSGIRVFYYISPKIWAWYTSRALQIKQRVDRMFVILPFEKDFYAQYGMEVDYVGNPVADAVSEHQPDDSFLDEIQIGKGEKYIALLPGSRNQELTSILRSMINMAHDFPDWKFVLAAIRSVPEELYQPCREVPNISVVFDRTYDILGNAYAAIVTSGTATLETALWEVPQVVVYRSTSWLSIIIARMVIKVKFISLVNLIARREVVKELIQEDLSRENLRNELSRILNDEKVRNRILNEYHEIKDTLGKEPVSERAADKMIGYLKS